MARKIEVLMNQAITNRVSWEQDNTRVFYNQDSDTSLVYLYNKLIAVVADGWIMLRDGGRRSATTKSRLAAILSEHGADDSIRQKNGQWLVTTNGQEIPFTNCMILS